MREHADVVFPAEAYPEKEGTLVHPDGRVQRLRPAIGRPRGAERPAGHRRAPAVAGHRRHRARARLRRPATCRTGAQVSRRLFDAVPFYAGLTLEEIGGRGVRWPERDDVRLARLGAREARGPGRARPPPPTARCASAPTARCGRPRRSTSRRRCTSSAPARSPSSRRPTPTRSASARATASRSATARACRRRREAARRDPRRQRVPRRGHARGQRQRAHRRPRRGPPRRRRARVEPSAIAVQIAARRRGPVRDAAVRPAADPAAGGHVMLLRRGRLLRAVVDADRSRRSRSSSSSSTSCRSRCSPTARCSAASSTATARTASARSARCSRSPTSASCSSRSSSARARRTAGCSRSRPVISMMTAAATIAIIPFSRRRRHLRHPTGPLRRRPVDRHPVRVRVRRDRVLRPDARRLGLGLEVLASSARCAPPRS